MDSSDKPGNKAIRERLEELGAEYEKCLAVIMAANRNSRDFRDSVVRAGELEEAMQLKNRLEILEKKTGEAHEILESSTERDISELARDELQKLQGDRREVEQKLKAVLFPAATEDLKNAIIEIRAGIGGGEASLFARDLFRMYSRFCERVGYDVEILSTNQSELSGFREIIFLVRGREAYKLLKHESGVHRVQRIPDTESSGRIHTSAATVAVFPEAEEREIRINTGDITIDAFRASGHGGQSVNKTSSAVRITHIPSGIVVVCQDERSQMQNRIKAMKILRARLQNLYETQNKSKIDNERREQVKTGERSEKIRTYNFPQNRVTDHRINLTLYSLSNLMEGAMEELLENLGRELQ